MENCKWARYEFPVRDVLTYSYMTRIRIMACPIEFLGSNRAKGSNSADISTLANYIFYFNYFY